MGAPSSRTVFPRLAVLGPNRSSIGSAQSDAFIGKEETPNAKATQIAALRGKDPGLEWVEPHAVTSWIPQYKGQGWLVGL